MKIQRINENVIRCVLTDEEMRGAGVNIDDLMGNRDKAEEFLQYILSQAKCEVDFVTNGDVLNVQMSVMRDGGVSMMISDDQNAAIRAIAEQFKEKLREFSSVLEQAGAGLPGDTREPEDLYSADNVIRCIINGEADQEIVAYDFWARLSSMEECVRLARALSDIKDTRSDLLKYFGEYYICLHMNMKKTDIAKTVFVMSEYSDDVSSDTGDYLMVNEHGDVLIRDHAISQLLML